MKLILQKLIDQLYKVPSLKEVKVFNNQLSRMGKEDIILFPCAFIELVNIDYSSLGNRNQYADMTVRIHVVGESLTQGGDYDYEIYDIKDEVNQYLYGFSGDLFTPLQRSNESLDINHTNLYDYKIDYLTHFTEQIDLVSPQTVVIKEVSFDYDLDIDNPVIRTGDGIR